MQNSFTTRPFVSINISTSSDVLIARAKAMRFAGELPFKMADQVRIATAVSELTRNMLQHANGGICIINDTSTLEHIVMQVSFIDQGPGIADINLAMQDGYSTKNGMGLGLPGTYRLVDEMEVNSSNSGTEIKITVSRKVSIAPKLRTAH